MVQKFGIEFSQRKGRNYNDFQFSKKLATQIYLKVSMNLNIFELSYVTWHWSRSKYYEVLLGLNDKAFSFLEVPISVLKNTFLLSSSIYVVSRIVIIIIIIMIIVLFLYLVVNGVNLFYYVILLYLPVNE